MEKKYHYFYQVINTINGNFYYGIHSTDNLDDGYMGSGARLHSAFKIYGKENFIKNILKQFKTRQEASSYEAEVVTENLVADVNCYNIKCGGDFGKTLGTMLVVDKEGVLHRVTPNDEALKNGDVVPFMTGKVAAFDKTLGKYTIIDCEEYEKNKDRYTFHFSGKQIVKDKCGKYYHVDVNDERILNGELTFVWSGRRHKDETKKKMSETKKLTKSQCGEKNSQYGTC